MSNADRLGRHKGRLIRIKLRMDGVVREDDTSRSVLCKRCVGQQDAPRTAQDAGKQRPIRIKQRMDGIGRGDDASRIVLCNRCVGQQDAGEQRPYYGRLALRERVVLDKNGGRSEAQGYPLTSFASSLSGIARNDR